MPRAEQVTGPDCLHGEGPVWWAGWGGLRFVDLERGDLMSLSADGSLDRRHVGRVLAAMRPRAGGGAVLALERGFALEDPDGTISPLPEVWSQESVRMNDGGADPHGRFYCGSMHYDEVTGRGALYRLEPDGTVDEVFAGVTISNGLEWSPDGRLAYYNDTPTHRIDVFDYDEVEGLTGRRPFADLSDEQGNPDGLTVDAEGGVWTALYGMGQVRRYAPDGRLDLVLDVPASQVTACTFGGDDLRTLYVTTANRGLPPGAEPAAGALFAYDAPVGGQPARTYAG